MLVPTKFVVQSKLLSFLTAASCKLIAGLSTSSFQRNSEDGMVLLKDFCLSQRSRAFPNKLRYAWQGNYAKPVSVFDEQTGIETIIQTTLMLFSLIGIAFNQMRCSLLARYGMGARVGSHKTLAPQIGRYPPIKFCKEGGNQVNWLDTKTKLEWFSYLISLLCTDLMALHKDSVVIKPVTKSNPKHKTSEYSKIHFSGILFQKQEIEIRVLHGIEPLQHPPLSPRSSNLSIPLGEGPESTELDQDLDNILPDIDSIHLLSIRTEMELIDNSNTVSLTEIVDPVPPGLDEDLQWDEIDDSHRNWHMSMESNDWLAVDAWQWRFSLENEEDSLLEELAGSQDRLELLIQHLNNSQSTTGSLEQNPAQLPPARGYDSESGSLGESIHDPPAFWLQNSQSEDSGTDDRMVNLPVYFNNPESEDSEYLDYTNWLDLYTPGHINWVEEGGEPQSGSDYGPEHPLEGSTPSISSGPASPLFPFHPPQQIISPPNMGSGNSTSESPELSPQEVHWPHCNCLGCSRFSPTTVGGHYSFPADMEEVARRLHSYVERSNLEVQVDSLHQQADLDILEALQSSPTDLSEEDDIRSAWLLNMDLQEDSEEYYDIDIDLIHASGTLADLEIIREHRYNNSYLNHGDSDTPASEVDIDMIHLAAEMEEEYIKQKFWEHQKGLATAAMVEECTRQHRLRRQEAQRLETPVAGPSSPPNHSEPEPGSNMDTTPPMPESWFDPP